MRDFLKDFGLGALVLVVGGFSIFWALSTDDANVKRRVRVSIEVDTAGTSTDQNITFAIDPDELPTWGVGYGHVPRPAMDSSTDKLGMVQDGDDAIVMWYGNQDTAQFRKDGWSRMGAGWFVVVHDIVSDDSFYSANGTTVMWRPLSDTVFSGSLFAGDVNGSGKTNIADVTWLVTKLFRQ